MKFYNLFFIGLFVVSLQVFATDKHTVKIDSIITKKEFLSYKNVGEFIDNAPKVTIEVAPDKEDIAEYGAGVVKTLTGSDCDRDGKMDDNQQCNATYYKLWLKYKR